MRLRKVAVATLACTVLGAVAASGAQATVHWNISGGELAGSEELGISGGPWILTSTVLGAAIELQAASLSCASGVECKIFGSGESSGQLTFNAVTVAKPANCLVPGGTITTNPLKGQVILDPAGGEAVFDKVEPSSGTTLAEFELAGTLCPFAEISVPLSGSLTGESPLVMSVEAPKQEFTFGSSQQATGGGALTLGSNAAVLAGAADNELAGVNAGAEWGAAEAVGGAWLSITRSGGKMVASKCEFNAVGQKCQVKFKNITARTLRVVNGGVKGEKAAERYAKVAEGCVPLLGLGECTDEVEVKKYEAGKINDYCLTVEDKAIGVLSRRPECTVLRM